MGEIRRNSSYSLAEWRTLSAREQLDPKAIVQRLRAALDEAEAFVAQMPTTKRDCCSWKVGERVVLPDPKYPNNYQTHAGQRGGQWPTSADISAAMLERYRKPSPQRSVGARVAARFASGTLRGVRCLRSRF